MKFELESKHRVFGKLCNNNKDLALRVKYTRYVLLIPGIYIDIKKFNIFLDPGMTQKSERVVCIIFLNQLLEF